jgi:hypothetical protein
MNAKDIGLRPRLLKTLKDLKDFIAHAEQRGARPTDNVFYTHRNDDELDSVTALWWGKCDCERECEDSCSWCEGFFSFEHWTEEELHRNTIHNDELGSEDHYVSGGPTP